ncbi:UNVERIFIED_CONTAM: magnesium chelatase family protein [Brevibacillus sp. OAP136]
MYARAFSGTVHGIDGLIVTVEVDIANGLPQFDVVGLGGSAVKESRDRVRSALRNNECQFPIQRITVNLAPADMRKEGSGFDLAIALGILAASEQIKETPVKMLVLGELALDGSVRPVTGVLPILLEARRHGFTHAIVPLHNKAEAELVDLNIRPVRTLKEAVRSWLHPNANGNENERLEEEEQSEEIILPHAPVLDQNVQKDAGDFGEVLGQAFVKRGLEVAAAGFHNVLLIGPPGSGKTMLANCMPSVMPGLSMEEAFEVTKIYSISGQLSAHGGLIGKRPFRSPHHTITAAALAGGGSHAPRPGECSLAHNGILFLDEMPEFSRAVLEVLRQPLEAGYVTIGRAKQIYTYPARFLLIASMNPCPSGFYLSPDQRECTCTPLQVMKYRSKISGPLLDRIDLHLEVPRVPVELLGERRQEELSATIRKRVEHARAVQTKRFSGRPAYPFNSGMNGKDLRKHAQLNEDGKELLQAAFETLKLSARAYDRILKVARTIADLDNAEQLQAHHVAEAIRYRTLDRGVLA